MEGRGGLERDKTTHGQCPHGGAGVGDARRSKGRSPEAVIRDEEEAWDVAAETVAVGHLEVGLGHVLSPHTVGALARGFISNLAGEPAVEGFAAGTGPHQGHPWGVSLR